MVVRERRGRKRYILFLHDGKSKEEILKKLKGIYLAFYSRKFGIVRCIHTKKEETIHYLKKCGFITLKTSGTIKKLKEYMKKINNFSPGGAR